MNGTHTWQPHMGIIHRCHRASLCHVDGSICTCSVLSSPLVFLSHMHTLSLSVSLSICGQKEEQTDNKWGELSTPPSPLPPSPPFYAVPTHTSTPSVPPLPAPASTREDQVRVNIPHIRTLRCCRLLRLESVLHTVSSAKHQM